MGLFLSSSVILSFDPFTFARIQILRLIVSRYNKQMSRYLFSIRMVAAALVSAQEVEERGRVRRLGLVEEGRREKGIDREKDGGEVKGRRESGRDGGRAERGEVGRR